MYAVHSGTQFVLSLPLIQADFSYTAGGRSSVLLVVTVAEDGPWIPGWRVMSPSQLVMRVPCVSGCLATMAPPAGFSSRLLLMKLVCTLAVPILHLLRTADLGMVTPLRLQLSNTQPSPNVENGAFL